MPGLFKSFGSKKLRDEVRPAAEKDGGSGSGEASEYPVQSASAMPQVGLAAPAAKHPLAGPALLFPSETATEPPPEQQPGSGALGDLKDIFGGESDERDQFHREIAKSLENVSARSLLQESREIARSIRGMPLRQKPGRSRG